MARFIFRRMLWMVLVLFVISLMTFSMMHAVPGGPFDTEKRLPPKIIEKFEAKYNLDAPYHIQYRDYMVGIAIPIVTVGGQTTTLGHAYLINIPLPLGKGVVLRWGDFGPSYKSASRTVSDIFRDNLPVSIELGAVGFLLAVLLGIPLGIIAALKRNTSTDYTAMGVAILGVSVPAIILGPILQYLFSVNLKWLPVTGWGELTQVILPAFALGFPSSAIIARLTRASLLQVLNQDYIRTARAKGLREWTVIVVHALKNSMIPVVTAFGPMLANILTGSFIIETMFGIPGMGRFFVTSISGRDYPVIMATALSYAVFLVVGNVVVDATYVWLDPRIQYSPSGRNK